MTKSLKDHFSMIRNREEVLKEIHQNENLLSIYDSWTEKSQNLFIEYCTGMRGIKILYDQFFKAIINPENTPERLEDILSLILNEKVHILQVLPNESTRIAAEKSLLVLDIVVELENKSIANVEVQRVGYSFPGQRSACYSADLLMRQYKRVKGRKKKKFKYSDIKKVYTIVFFENSTSQFHQFPTTYLHKSKQQTNTGLSIDLLQEYIFIALDIFKTNLHNKGIDTNNRLEAWLTFLSEDDPEWILKLIEAYPEFESLYEEVYKTCQNTEAMMGLFSEELLEMDRNTYDFMVDEMQEIINKQKATIKENEETIKKNEETIKKNKSLIDKQQLTIDEQQFTIDEQKMIIEELKAQLLNK